MSSFIATASALIVCLYTFLAAVAIIVVAAVVIYVLVSIERKVEPKIEVEVVIGMIIRYRVTGNSIFNALPVCMSPFIIGLQTQILCIGTLMW